MTRLSSPVFPLLSFVLGLGVAGCGAAPAADPAAPSEPAAQSAEPAPVAVVVPAEPASEQPALATMMVEAPGDGAMTAVVTDDSIFALSASDPALGRPDALVTLVVFGDLQCPFTARLFGTMENLRRHYGEGELRIVWKHLPLPFHKEAAPAAEASVAVHRLGGPRAFFCFLGEVFDNQRNLDGALYRQAAQKCGVSPAAMEAEVRSGAPARKVEDDQRLATETASRGTPDSFVNGVRVSGAQPIDKFMTEIDREKEAARSAIASGVPAQAVHAARVKENFSKPEPRPTASPTAVRMPDTAVYKVPVGQSPVLGSPNALVTIVMFQDFQCPFCKRSAATIEQLRNEFGADLRVVFKHNPLAFHPQAMPAAQLAMEAKAQKGNTGFWQASDALFAEASLDDAVLEQVAQKLGLNVHAARSAMANNRHRAAIDADVQLANQLGATGTPTFFINGRKLTGAQPVETFRSLINEVLPAARALTQRGIPRSRVYDETIKSGVTGPANP